MGSEEDDDRYVSDKTLDRRQRDRHHQERLQSQALRERSKHEQAIEKIRTTNEHKAREQEALTQLDRETAISLKLLDHALKPEELDLEFNELIRRSDIELQTLQAELHLRDEIADREHARNIDYVYQSTMIEITKETARILDEQNKAIAIDQQETQSKMLLEQQQHQQTLKKDYLDHQYEMERDKLLSTLKKDEFTHEEIMRVLARLLAKKLGVNEHEISSEDLDRWAEEFPL